MSKRRERRERRVRRLIPSSVLLSQKRWLMAPLDAVDRLSSAPFREFRRLPPNRYRIRIGVGNRMLFNQPHFLTRGLHDALTLFARGLARPDSNVVDIGCGCGTLPYALRRGEAFTGGYTGIDVDPELIRWCEENLGDVRFRFVHADIYSKLYNPTGSRQPYRLPLPDSSQDLVTSQSLFTHLLDEEMDRYIAESHRVLNGGGHMAMTVFCIEDMEEAGDLGGRWTFVHRQGRAYVENRRYPEAAVAYERADLEDRARAAGFSDVRIEPADAAAAVQSLFVARR